MLGIGLFPFGRPVFLHGLLLLVSGRVIYIYIWLVTVHCERCYCGQAWLPGKVLLLLVLVALTWDCKGGKLKRNTWTNAKLVGFRWWFGILGVPPFITSPFIRGSFLNPKQRASTNIFFTNIYESTNINANYTLFKTLDSQPTKWVGDKPVIFFPKKPSMPANSGCATGSSGCCSDTKHLAKTSRWTTHHDQNPRKDTGRKLHRPLALL